MARVFKNDAGHWCVVGSRAKYKTRKAARHHLALLDASPAYARKFRSVVAVRDADGKWVKYVG